MTDEELDRDWKPSGRRPQSTIAQSFSKELMDIFRIENSVADLDEEVNKRKQHVNTQTNELSALEARIQEMEARLRGERPAAAASASGAAPNQQQQQQRQQQQQHAAAASSSSSAAAAVATTNASSPRSNRPLEYRQRHDREKYGSSQPGTARDSKQAVPGALPPTPVGSDDGDDR